MGIRKKIFWGCTVVAFVLLLAGVIIMFEMKQMRANFSAVLSENEHSMNAAYNMQRSIDNQNTIIFNYATESNDSILNTLQADLERFNQEYELAKSRITISGESEIIDSINSTYVKYQQIVNEIISADSKKLKNFVLFSQILNNEYKIISEQIEQLFNINKKALEENSLLMNENYYRMIMPAIIAIAAGIVLIFLFNYFLNIYLISPIIKITKGVNAFTSTRVPYNVEVETKDEMQNINEEIKDLTELVRRKEKEERF